MRRRSPSGKDSGHGPQTPSVRPGSLIKDVPDAPSAHSAAVLWKSCWDKNLQLQGSFSPTRGTFHPRTSQNVRRRLQMITAAPLTPERSEVTLTDGVALQEPWAPGGVGFLVPLCRGPSRVRTGPDWSRLVQTGPDHILHKQLQFPKRPLEAELYFLV
ncbi:uncharacterized protein V6R79_012059 [Siganus canaliculatus]